ncbi:MAG: maleylacetoacetate isomerase [Ectothiorhodospiraceae bacterium]|nr:maleylacetoacetate isomerase [Ectothiorhodospiraceae bacterium]MCH8503307.1 maleylacetoacetate isomerase [Ectothiorhodospiraceae bacterium]
MSHLTLYEYFRSTSSFRARIALNVKGLPYAHASVHLRRDGGEQFGDTYTHMNPQQLVPTLVDGEHALIQSLAIIEYLEETHPEPPLLPEAPADRARVRAFAQIAACEVHPLHNLRVLEYLRAQLGQDEEAVTRWIHTWMAAGFRAMEALLADPRTGRHCHGDRPGLADLCLVPQVFTAERFGVDLAPYEACRRIHRQCMELDAFQQAVPSRQPDAE